jgi:UDP-N-acetylmuramoylalanine--D-glutamate ligase
VNLAGRHVIVVGLGASGFAAARALIARDAKVHVTEASTSETIRERASWLQSQGADVAVGGHAPIASDADLAIVSPGVPLRSEFIQSLYSDGVTVWSEVELAYRLADCTFLAVTGTNGKTTTTSLLAEMLAAAGVESVAAGNIGLPLIDAVSSISRNGVVVAEVSSFQLAAIESFRPHVAVVLNVAEDHTDWHGTQTAYLAAKARIVENQTADDFVIFNLEDEGAREIAAHGVGVAVPFSSASAPAHGIGVAGGRMRWMGTEIFDLDDLSLVGAAGVEDALAAAGAALAFGIDERAAGRAMKSFRPLPHRMEIVAAVDNVTYIDDSKATNPHATLSAVRGLKDVVLIAGGRSKGIDLSVLEGVVPPVIAAVALGEAAQEVAAVLGPLVEVVRAASMDEAVAAATARSKPGGSVLLSPACASLDMYESYAARGEDFARAVRAVIEGRGGDEVGNSK